MQAIPGRASRVALRAEMYRVLGWYSFQDDRIDIASPRTLGNYPADLIATHEATHVMLTRSALYGMILVYFVTVVENAARAGVSPPFPKHPDLGDILVGGCFSVQEGLACFRELLHCSSNYPAYFGRRLLSLPSDYAQSLELLTRAFGECDAFGPDKRGDLERRIAVTTTLARCAMDSPNLACFNDPENLTGDRLRDHLATDSPNDRFSRSCETIASRNAGQHVCRIWSMLAVSAATRLGIPVSMTDGLASYYSGTREQIDAVDLAIQPEFLAQMATEGFLPFPWIASLADRTRYAQELTAGWSDRFERRSRRTWTSWFRKRENVELFPYSRVQMGGAANHEAAIRRNYHARTRVSSLEARQCGSISADRLRNAIRQILSNGSTPLVSFERASDGSPVVTLWILRIPTSVDERVELVEGPVLASVDPEVLKSFADAHAALLTTSDLEGALWHYDADLLNSFHLSPTATSRGHTVFTFDQLAVTHLIQRIDALSEQGYTVTVRLLGFHESPAVFLVVHPLPSTFSTCWPGDYVSFQALKERYLNDGRVVFGGANSNENAGEILDLRVLHSIVCAAYRL